MNKMIPIERIESKIYQIQGQKVMIDFDLAGLYGVPNKQLKRQVNRNRHRFPADFMFQLTKNEYHILRCQFGTLRWGAHTKYLPYAFTEQGVAMLSSVLNSEKAVEVNIRIMRAFVQLRKVLSTNKDLTYLFKELKHKVDQHDNEIGLIIRTIEKMVEIEKKPKRGIGFLVDKREQERGK